MTDRHNTSDLIQMFEELGYEISWDFSKHEGLYWNEIINPKTMELVAQIEFGVSKEKFLSEWFDDDLEYASFFIAGDEESDDWKELAKKLEKYK